MLTQLTIRNFKGLGDVDIELGDRVVFIGPNNSGKTSALQALALWDVGLKRWIEKRGVGGVPKKRPGVTVNRRDLIAVPVPEANLLWRNLHVRGAQQQSAQNIRIEIVVKGVDGGQEWECGLEFDYANEDAFYCRPLRLNDVSQPERMAVPEEAKNVQIAFLPPMSGLTATESRLDPGAINVRIGEGRTAEVLRNLCHRILDGEEGEARWNTLVHRIHHLFGVKLERPEYIIGRGEITLAYKDPRGARLDISASGRGLQQTLLLLAHMSGNPGSVLLLDEPDAHLEILRQRQIYQVLTDIARENRNQIISASHSEVVLNEAADRDMVVAFVGRPHRIDDRGTQVLKSLKEIGFDHYYQAEEVGWVLYLEGSTDLAILRALAEVLDHPCKSHLERPFVHYVQNHPTDAQRHFHGLREAKPDLVGFALYDRLDRTPPDDLKFQQVMWQRREMENYVSQREAILDWTRWKASSDKGAGPLFAEDWVSRMDKLMTDLEEALVRLRKPSPWSADIKVTDDFLDPLFADFFEELRLPNLMRKTSYHELARFVRADALDPEVTRVLDGITEVASRARPRRD